MMEINMDPGVVWLFAFAAFLLAAATGIGVGTFYADGDKSKKDRAVGAGYVAFAITAVPWFVLLIWLFNDSPALQ